MNIAIPNRSVHDHNKTIAPINQESCGSIVSSNEAANSAIGTVADTLDNPSIGKKSNSSNAEKESVANVNNASSNLSVHDRNETIASMNQESCMSIVTSNSANCVDGTVATIDFRVGEVVWAKIRGYAHWPALIKSMPSNRTAEVTWFNDYRKTKLFRTQLFKFLTHFERFAVRFEDVIGLKTAAQEGLIYYGQQFNRNA